MPEYIFSYEVSYLDCLGFLLLWIESLAIAILLVSVVCVLVSRLEKTLWRRLVVFMVAAIPLLIGIACSVLGWFMLSRNIQPVWFFAYSFAWTIAYICLCMVILKRSSVFQSDNFNNVLCIKRMIAFAIACAVWIATFYMMDAAKKEKLVSYQARITAQGKSMLPKPVSVVDNAMLIYNKAYDELVDHDGDSFFENINVESIDPTSEKAKAFLAMQTKSFELIRMASAMGSYYFHVGLSIDSPLPSLSPYITFAKMMSLDARAKAIHGDFSGAFEDVLAIHRMADHVGRTPLLLSSIVGGRVHQIASLAQEYILANSVSIPKGFKTDFAARYGNLLYNYFKQSMVVEGLKLKSASIRMMINDDVRNEYGINPLAVSVYRVFFEPYDIAFLDKYWQKLDELYRQPVFDALAGMDDFEKDLEESSLLISVAMLDYNEYVEHIATAQARLLLADAGVSIARYRQEHGHYPKTFAELIPDYLSKVPTDPFNGEPIHMKHSSNGLILYSVGHNLKDDGGLAYDKVNKTGDISFYMGEAYTRYRLQIPHK